MGFGQAEGVLLESLDAEELGADRLFFRGRTVEAGGAFHLVLPSRDVTGRLDVVPGGGPGAGDGGVVSAAAPRDVPHSGWVTRQCS
jgi:hypothetical protein